MMSDTKPRRRVQPITLPMTSMTGVGNLEIEKPRLPVKSLAEVAQVLLPQRGVAEPERLFEGLDLVGAQLTLEARDHARHRVSRHEAGKEEVEGDRHPERDEIEPEASQHVAHVVPPGSSCCAASATQQDEPFLSRR